MDLYRPKQSFGQGNIFTSVCLSTGGSSIFRGVSNFSGVSNFLGEEEWPPIFWGFSNFPGGISNWNTVNIRPVRILLECILVFFFFSLFSTFPHIPDILMCCNIGIKICVCMLSQIIKMNLIWNLDPDLSVWYM